MPDKIENENPSPGLQDASSSEKFRQSPFEQEEHAFPQGNYERKKLTPFSSSILGLILIGIVIIGFLTFSKTLTIKTNASNTLLTSNRLLSFQLDDRLILLGGEHDILVQAPGYKTQSFTFKLSAEKHQQHSVELSPLPGHLIVKTDAEDINAEIFLDNKSLGRLGEKITNVEAGNYEMTVRSQRYQTLSRPIQVEGKGITEELSVSLEPNWIITQISSFPKEAKVFIDGREVGITPVNVELIAGVRQLEIHKEGYNQQNQSLFVDINSPINDLHYDLNKVGRKISLQSNPINAQIIMDGVYLGQTPLELEIPNNQSANILLVKDGYESKSFSIPSNLNNNSENSNSKNNIPKNNGISIKLKPTLAKLNIIVSPADALLKIINPDESRSKPEKVLRSSKVASYDFLLPARPYSFSISKAGYETKSLTITPRPNQNQSINISLMTKSEKRWKSIKNLISTSNNQEMKLFKPNASFMMGSKRREQGRRANETQYLAELNRPFYLSMSLVNNRQYRTFEKFHSSSNYKGKSLNGDQQPVVKVSWLDAAKYCNWLSEQEGLDKVYNIQTGRLVSSDISKEGYRLPTEAEWAWAARWDNGDMLTRGWPSSSLTPPNNFANLSDETSRTINGSVLQNYRDKFLVSSPVMSFSPNHHGLYDLTGNVSEWVHDLYGINTGLSLKPKLNPSGPVSGDKHVIRGSNWKSSSLTEIRLAWRDSGKQGDNTIGFRIARTINLSE